MKHMMWGSAIATLLVVAGWGADAEAGLCGAARYNCCPTPACAPCGGYHHARRCCTGYRTVKEVVWEQQEYCDQITVYDTCCEKVPVTCTRTVFDTCYRDVPYSYCRPVYKTCYKTCCYQVRIPQYKTCYRTVTCNVRRPV
jgi:hypothetical protein